MRKVLWSVVFLALVVAVGAAEALPPCSVTLSYPNAGPTPKNQTAYVYSSVTLGYGAQIDDDRSYSLVSVSGPGNLGASISSFSGRVTYNANASGYYTVTANVAWFCEGGGSTSSSTSFTVIIC